jgi:hypothetical protein
VPLGTDPPSGERWLWEGVEERVLVVLRGVADKGVPVGLAEALAHAKAVADAGAGLCEQGRPALGGAVATELADRIRDGACDLGSTAVEVKQRCVSHAHVRWITLLGDREKTGSPVLYVVSRTQPRDTADSRLRFTVIFGLVRTAPGARK